MTRGKKPLDAAPQHGEEFASKTPEHVAAPEARMNLAIQEAEGNARAVASQLGYEGALTVGTLEDEIRFYQRRTVEASLELGKRLLILKELTPHGEFGQRLDLLGINPKMGRKFMAATIKFSKRSSTSVLQAAGSQTKLLELLTLDDGEIAALEAGESARGITLDEIDTMTVSELRAALREAGADGEAKDRLLEEKNRKLDELARKSRKHRPEPWPEEVAGMKDDLHGLGKILDEVLGKHLTLIDATELETDKLADAGDQPDALAGWKTVIHQLGEQIERACTLAAALRHDYDTRLAGHVAMDKSRTLED